MNNDLISRQVVIDEIMGQPPEPHYPTWYAEQIKALPSARPDVPDTNVGDIVSRQTAIDAIKKWGLIDGLSEGEAIEILSDEEKVPPVTPQLKTQEEQNNWLYDIRHFNNTYQKELNIVRQELLDRPDQHITFKDLVERFDKVDKWFDHSPWNLLQIYSNFNILKGEITR